MNKLPTYEECFTAINNSKANQLERFIYKYEPADRTEEFRSDLLRLVNELTNDKNK